MALAVTATIGTEAFSPFRWRIFSVAYFFSGWGFCFFSCSGFWVSGVWGLGGYGLGVRLAKHP
jgi:hypothetical protein